MRAAKLAVVLGVALTTGGAGIAAVAASSPSVHGTVAGSYRLIKTNLPDSGVRWRVHGHGRTSLGATQAAGHVMGPGFISKGPCTTRVVLTTADGSVTIRGRSDRDFPGFSKCQSGFALHWHIVSGTGADKGATGSGTGTLTLVKPRNSSETPPPFYLTLDRG
jgi:hypothetical protein